MEKYVQKGERIMTSKEALYRLYLIAEQSVNTDEELIELNELAAIILSDLTESQNISVCNDIN